MTAPTPGPLDRRCAYCLAKPGERCRIVAPRATVGKAVYGPFDFHRERWRAAAQKAREEGK